MTKPKKTQNGQKKRTLSSPDNGGDGQPEKKTSVDTTSSQENNGTFQNSVNSQGYIQPMNMSSMNNYANYQTPVGTFYTPPQQQFLPQHINLSSEQNTNFQQTILDRFDSLDKKLGKLDSIENKISTISQKMTSMDTRLSALEHSTTDSNQKMQDLEKSRLFDSQSVDELKSKQSELDQQFKVEKEKVESLSREYAKIKTVREDILDLQARSMRDNLLFMGFRECDSFESRRAEICTKSIHDFCRDTLKISDAHDAIKIERAHRLGKYNKDKTRPIVVKFNHYPDKMLIKNRASSELKESQFRVTEQFPKGIQEKRKYLSEALMKARNAGRTATLSYDKLYIDGKMYTIDTVGTSGFT